MIVGVSIDSTATPSAEVSSPELMALVKEASDAEAAAALLVAMEAVTSTLAALTVSVMSAAETPLPSSAARLAR